ncbi:MAG: hypothetical protein AAFX99_04510 [Myxococcota bacterium]
MAIFDGTLTLSSNLDYFEHRGVFFVYHNLFGYILELSRDLLDFLEWFRGHERTAHDMREQFRDTFDNTQMANFINVFELQACLITREVSEEDMALKMVPVHARSTVYHTPPTGPIRLYNALRVSDRIEALELDDWDSAFWRAIDEERRLSAIIDLLRDHPDSPGVGLEQKALATLFKFTHCEAQFLKLSPRPMSVFRAATSKRGVPPYLRSTMPFTRVTDEIRGETSVRVGLDVVDDAEISATNLDADAVEATFAHLFRDRHTALDNRSYGGALAHTLAEHLAAHDPLHILEVDAVRGELARGFLNELRSVHPELYGRIHYTALVATDHQLASTTAELEAAGHGGCSTVQIQPIETLGDAELTGPFALVLCNEALARLETALLRKITIGDEEPEEDAEEEEGGHNGNGNGKGKQARDMYLGEGDAVNVVFRHNLTFHDIQGEFLFNVGAVRFLEQAAPLLAVGGRLVLIEFGELFEYPEMTGEDGAEQFSIHFGALQEVGKSLGLEPAFEWLVSWVEGLDRGAQMLVANRHYFRALRHLLETQADLHLETRAWTRTMIEPTIEAKISLEQVHRLEYRSLNDRVMGLVTSSLKVLELVRPDPNAVPEEPEEDEDAPDTADASASETPESPTPSELN